MRGRDEGGAGRQFVEPGEELDNEQKIPRGEEGRVRWETVTGVERKDEFSIFCHLRPASLCLYLYPLVSERKYNVFIE